MMRGGTRISTLFLPALCVYPVWLTIGIREDVLVSSAANYYPMMIAMVLGSMIAGSTPLGGGVVAFPVSVLVLGFSPDQGRDFSLLIQSVGMTAASFLIFYKKRFLLRGYEDTMVKFSVWSIVGMIIGFECLGDLSPYIVNMMYTTTVVCIAIVLAYFDFIAGQRKTATNAGIGTEATGDNGGNDDGNDDRKGNGNDSKAKTHDDVRDLESDTDKQRINADFLTVSLETTGTINMSRSTEKGRRWTATMFASYICLPLFAIAGGILSSQIGTGADIACYFYGCFYNAVQSRRCNHPHTNSPETQISANALTAASVIVMANTSIFGSILRLTTRQNSVTMAGDQVYYALMACAPIVVLGAPLGSLLLTPSNQQRLKCAFYVLGILQLLLFGIIKIGNDYVAWSGVVGIISFVLTSLGIHYLISCRRPGKG